jgi:hypothetical protein
MKAQLIAVVAALAIAHFATATNHTPHYDAPSQQTVNPSKDSVTKSQAKAAGMLDIVENFEKIDSNKDGRITRNEMRAYVLATRRHVPMT